MFPRNYFKPQWPCQSAIWVHKNTTAKVFLQIIVFLKFSSTAIWLTDVGKSWRESTLSNGPIWTSWWLQYWWMSHCGDYSYSIYGVNEVFLANTYMLNDVRQVKQVLQLFILLLIHQYLSYQNFDFVTLGPLCIPERNIWWIKIWWVAFCSPNSWIFPQHRAHTI